MRCAPSPSDPSRILFRILSFLLHHNLSFFSWKGITLYFCTLNIICLFRCIIYISLKTIIILLTIHYVSRFYVIYKLENKVLPRKSKSLRRTKRSSGLSSSLWGTPLYTFLQPEKQAVAITPRFLSHSQVFTHVVADLFISWASISQWQTYFAAVYKNTSSKADYTTPNAIPSLTLSVTSSLNWHFK